jgi:23S rRNA (cytosine1962-C5)-methyltransferase
MNALPCVTLNRHAQERAKKRHPWVFSNELSDPKRFARLEPGSLVDVLDCHGDYLGTGFVNPKSLIAVRILSRRREEAVDAEFFARRLEAALEIRDALYGAHTDSAGTFRAVFGEADGLPGLVIDRFEGAWVVEPHAKGMEVRRVLIAEALAAVARKRYGGGAANIFYRTDSRAAQMEGIEVKAEILSGAMPGGGAWAVESGIRFPVDPLQGQKTGFFFDQRDNRAFFESWVKGELALGREVRALDLFCHAGAWGLRALKAGASRAVFVDSSAAALESVQRAAKEMGWADRVECIQGDAPEVLRKMKERSFDAVSLDPPALIPNKKSLPQGAKAYRDLNAQAARLMIRGGLLSTSSCSYHMQEDRFEESVARGLAESGREGRVIRRGAMGADHPVIANMEEGRYLKNLSLVMN